MTRPYPDPGLVDAFLSGGLDEQGQATLARQVAGILPAHWSMPNPTAAALSALTRRLGGESGLLAWLDRFPGLPRLVATVYSLIDLLDRLSDRPPVVAALAELRETTATPPEVATHLVPETTADTLASLSGQLESLLADGRYTEVIAVSRATVELLTEVVDRARRAEPSLGELLRQLERFHGRFQRAGT